MNEEAVIARKVGDWHRLGELSAKADGGFRRMSGQELTEFVRLYRKASGDLALLATQTSNAEVVDYLNSIVSKAYGQIYRAPRRPLRESVAEGVVTGARVFRRNFVAFALATVLFVGGAFTSFGLIRAKPELREQFVAEEMEENFDHWKTGRHEAREGGENVAMTAFYASNNPRVGILSTAASVATFGTFTAYLLWANGAILGALASDMASVGKLGFLLSSVAPHGVSEVGGLLVTSAAGFVLAWALICPGRRSRGESLRLAGKDALVLMLVGVAMICIAAPIEGFFSFNPLVPQWAKVAFAFVSLGAWSAYFGGYGREGTGMKPG